MITTGTPIYDRLRAEMTSAPLCQVCGTPELHGLLTQEHWLLCRNCWLMNFGYAEERKRKTCFVCGKFPLDWNDHMVWVRDKPAENGWQVDMLCRKHFEEREMKSGTGNS